MVSQRCILVAACAVACLALQAQAARTLQAAAAPGPAPSEFNATCPPPGFDAVPSFNFTEYISESWYALAQIPLVYQPPNQFYCVEATYVPQDPSDVLKGVTVINRSNIGGVNGTVTSTSAPGAPSLIGTIPDPSFPSKLEVGFDFPGESKLVGTQFKPGPYWVIATGESADGGYDWAIVSGGAPVVAAEGGCQVPGAKIGVQGMWLFSRDPLSSDNYEAMMAYLEEMGIDTSVLLPVEHEGCAYDV